MTDFAGLRLVRHAPLPKSGRLPQDRIGDEDADEPVQHEGRAAEHAVGDGEDQHAELRGERQDEGGGSGHPVGGGRVDAGGGHDPDVLGVGGGAGPTAETGQGRGQAVGEQRIAGDVVEIAPGHRGHGLDVAGVLGDEDDHHGQRDQHARQLEGGAAQLRDAEPCGLAQRGDPVVGQSTGDGSEHPADDDAHEDAEPSEQTRTEHGDQQHRDQCDRRDERLSLERADGVRCQVPSDERDDRTTASSMPTATMPPNCAAGPSAADAVSGAMNAKDEPR